MDTISDGRVLVLMPTSKDGDRAFRALAAAGIECTVCQDMGELCSEIGRGAGMALLTEEALEDDRQGYLQAALAGQPHWSDFPLVFLAREGAEKRRSAIRETMNATLVERPVKVRSLLSVVRAALRSRLHQYEVRDYLAERKFAEADRARLAAIVESSDDAIVSKSLDGTVMTWNAGAERLFGYKSSEIVGNSITRIIPPERIDEEIHILERLRRGERIEHFETVRVSKDGRRIHVSLTVSPIRDASGFVVGASKVARDVTDRVRAEEALKEADRRKDDFIALLAHELRNPLAPIRNGLQVLKLSNGDGRPGEDTRKMMDRQLTHMVRLIDDLLDVSRISRNKLELRRERVSLSEVIASAVETAQPVLDAAEHKLTVSLPSEPVDLDADLTRLAQVFSNLLTNSAKYMHRGGHVYLTAERRDDSVSIAVRDHGIGIPADSLPTIFDMFSQVDRSIERTTGGLGIGLSIVKGLTEMHGGKVTAESDDHGSTFTVTLPVLAAKSDPRLEVSANEISRGVGHRILVVDDNRDGAESLSLMLQLMGNDVRTANDGVQGVELAEAFRPDIILMDVGMPKMNGYEATRQIRSQPWGREIVIHALTGWGQDGDRQLSREAGCDGHLVKPVSLPDLESKLREPIRGESRYRES